MRPSRKLARYGLAPAFVAALVLAGCSGDKAPATEKMTSYASSDTGPRPELFTVPPDQMAHVQVQPVEAVPLPRLLRLPGTVAYNAFRTTPVITQVNGPIVRILAAPGQKVRSGDTLAFVSSPDYATARTNYLKTRSAARLADNNYARAKDLFDHHAIAERDLLQAESERTQALADLQNSQQALRTMGVTNFAALEQDSARPDLPILSPISGEVVDRMVSPGQVVQAGQTQCFIISDMNTVWVLVNVYQSDMAWVRAGDPVVIQTDAYPDKFQGKISFVGAALDPNTRTLQARIVTTNPGEKLKKDMYVTALVRAGVIQNALAVPDSAILHDAENHPFVYVASGSNQFERRLVTLGEPADGRIQVVAGLRAGERIVSNGSLFLQFENSLQR